MSSFGPRVCFDSKALLFLVAMIFRIRLIKDVARAGPSGAKTSTNAMKIPKSGGDGSIRARALAFAVRNLAQMPMIGPQGQGVQLRYRPVAPLWIGSDVRFSADVWV